MRLEKIDLLEWGWHKAGDPSEPKGGFLWENPDYPDFYIMYDELEGCAYVLYRYAKGGSDAYNSIVEIYRFMDIHKGYEHENEEHLYMSAMAMDEWKKQQMIDKMCEWLEKHITNYIKWEYNEFHQCVEYDGSYDIEKMISDIRKAMEE